MTVPAGWYDQHDGTQRFWDGVAWTEHTAPSAPPSSAAGSGAPPAGQLAALPVAARPFAAQAAVQPAVQAAAPIAVPPGYAALPSQTPAAPARKRVWPWVLAIVCVVVLILIGLVVWAVVALLGAVTGPIDTVNKFEAAMVSGDCEAIKQTATSTLLTSNRWDQCDVFKDDGDFIAPSSFNANSSSINNAVATVTADVRYTGDTRAYVGTYMLIKQGDDWRVDAFSINSAGS